MAYSKKQVRQSWIRRRRRRGGSKELAPPAFTASPYIVPMAGPYYTGQELTVQYMASGFPTPTPTYEWYDVLTPIGGNVQKFTYTTATASAFAEVSLSNSEGGPVVDTTPPFEVVQSVLPAETSPAVIAGNQQVGSTLTRTTESVWTGPPGSGEPGFSKTWAWYKLGVAIPGTENAVSYVTQPADIGASIYTRDEATNYAGGPVQGALSNTITVADIPAAFTLTDWSVADAMSGGTANVTINSLPADNGSAITDIEYSVNGGTWTSSGGTGNFSITGLTDGVSTAIRIRAVNAIGPANPSDTKNVTTTALPGRQGITFGDGTSFITFGDGVGSITFGGSP